MASSKPDCLLEPPQTQPKESRHSLEGGHTCSHTHRGRGPQDKSPPQTSAQAVSQVSSTVYPPENSHLEVTAGL